MPADWTDGTEVGIHPLEQIPAREAGVMSPDEIPRTLAAMDRGELFGITQPDAVSSSSVRHLDDLFVLLNRRRSAGTIAGQEDGILTHNEGVLKTLPPFLRKEVEDEIRKRMP
jgi:hypothetical protein